MSATDWYQQALTPPEVIELRIRIGIIPESDHCQALAELIDPISGALVAQWSVAHAPADSWSHMLDTATAKGREQLESAIEPF